MRYSARYKMATPASTFGYVALLSKPWNKHSSPAVPVISLVQLMLYSGTFTEEDFAGIVGPIARGELVALPGATGTCLAWRGRATCMCLRQTSLFACVTL